MSTSASPQRAGRREWAGLAVLVLANLLVAMDVSVLYLAVPFITADLEPSSAQQLWILDVYGFLLAGLLITMGVLGDRFGRRRMLLLGAALFGAASVAAAYSSSAETLIGARAALGVAGAVLAPSTLALIRSMFRDGDQRRTAIAIWTAGFSGGAALGPLVSGVLLDHFWWGSVFLLNVPPMALLLILAPLLIPEYRDPRPGRFDLVGAVLSLAAVLPAVYGIKELAQDGVSAVPVAAVVAGLVLGALFVVWQRSRRDPMIDLALFRVRTFAVPMAVNLVAFFALVGFALYSTQWLQLVRGMGPMEAALWSLPAPAAVAVATTVASGLAKTVRPASIIGTGLLMTAAGFLVVTRVGVHSSLAVLVTGVVLVAAGLGVAMTLTADMILTAAPPERAGAASALSETGNQLGGALGVAIMGSIGAAIYRDRMGDAVPAGLPPRAVEAAEKTLGGAAEVAKGLPGDARSGLLGAARDAFVHGLNVNAGIAAGVVAIVAVVGTALLRNHGGKQTGPEEEGPEAAVEKTPEPAGGR
ncbi:MFS transporter [Actinomadura decatromicini]|uniref:MFS transporter n=1 Tax=Actinomadura decatromicini TaxID=2604572 RepID=A0A5D3F8A5_9ACTN|nr:MFS transporter [Actinomadura decatromicini]TYK43950.1 MFS transporter [Actinomadura decatromicini]